jgi:CrcB protein
MLGTEFPWHTLIVNVAGCFAMGLLTGLLALKLNLSQEARAFLTTGILGGFTTFSAFSLDVALLMERKAHLAAGAYAAGSVVLSLAAVFAGLHLIRLIVQ